MTEPAPENFSPFEKLLVERARNEIDFAVVGGVAVFLNGFVAQRTIYSNTRKAVESASVILPRKI